MDALAELKTRLHTITALEQAAMVLMWDQATHMPGPGGTARGAQLAALKQITHERATDAALGRLLDGLDDRKLAGADAALVRVARFDFDRKRRVPATLVERIAAHEVTSYQAWEAAREAADFALVAPALAQTVALSRQYADCFADADHVADPLIEMADPGQTVAHIQPLFTDLRQRLVPLVRAVAERAGEEPTLAGHFPEAAQLAVSRRIAGRFGYDFERGRLDLSAHPFTTSFSIDDVRITTRVREDDLTECLYSTLHEAGHGMYEQGVDRVFEGTPVAAGTSSGLHESQSRLWENQVGRSRGFCEAFFPLLREAFPQPLQGWDPERFYRAINRVRPSLIRTDADELTYNLHVMLRFDLELQLLTGDLDVSDLPEAWNGRIHADLGVTPADPNQGVLQDIHWFAGPVGGAFQGYTLGNIYSAQLFRAACRAHPEVGRQMAEGRFDALRNWLTANVYRHGRSIPADTVVTRATGQPPSIDPYMDYLTDKYGALYGL